MPPLQRVPLTINWSDEEQNSDALCVTSDAQRNRPRIGGIQIRKEAIGTEKRTSSLQIEKNEKSEQCLSTT